MYRESFEAFSLGKEVQHSEDNETPLDALEDCNTTFLFDEE